MPCNSDYLNASDWEIEISRVACLLDELKGKPIDPDHWRGYHPDVYGKCARVDGDNMVAALCANLRRLDVSNYSLEMQMWWRDHQKADAERVTREQAEAQKAADREAALAKLTDYERELLGV